MAFCMQPEHQAAVASVASAGQPGCQAVSGRAHSPWVQRGLRESAGFITREACGPDDSFRSATRFFFSLRRVEEDTSFHTHFL